MKHQFVHKADHRRLLVIFAGWSMDATPFKELCHDAYDILVVWDYTDFDGSLPVEGYGEVCVLAWSMGVWAAQQIIPQLKCPLSRCIAVNGTPKPIDNVYGIPVQIFHATLQNLSESNMAKFYRRISAGAWRTGFPARSIDSLRQELTAIAGRSAFSPSKAPAGIWDMAAISSNDAIFPIDAQRKAWEGTPIIELNGPHMPDFQALIDRFLINKPLVSHRFTKASSSYAANASVQSMISYDLWQKIIECSCVEVITNAHKIIEIGSGTGLFTAKYALFVGQCDWQLWDIADVPDEAVPDGAEFCNVDAEMAIRQLPDGSVNAILSSSALQWFGSPMRFLAECHRVLAPGGLLAFSSFDSNNMPEIREIVPENSLLTPSFMEFNKAISARFQLLAACSNKYTMLFEEPKLALKHMKDTGVNALRKSSPASARKIIENYPRNANGRYPLSYIPIIFVAKKL